MCGIAGIWSPTLPRQERLAIIEKMTDRLKNRGPDDMGAWSPEGDGIAFGHRRLSIIDLSAGGHQPKTSPSGRFVITFNGEIYNYLDLRRELEGRGRHFASTSDTEVLLQGFEEWGIRSTLVKSAGMFAMGIWDTQAKTLTLARDRIGEKPLYYAMVSNTSNNTSNGTINASKPGGASSRGVGFAFASEPEALRAIPGWSPAIDRTSLSLYFRYGYVPAPRSIFAGVAKLEAGMSLTVKIPDSGDSLKSTDFVRERFWSLARIATGAVSTQQRYSGSFEAASHDLESLVQQVISQQMISDVPLGAFLSGGVDSTTVVALMQRASDQPVKTFTIGFSESDFNEAVHAKAVAKHLGTDHHELYVNPAQAMDVIPRLPKIFDEPFADSSQIPTFLVAQMARAHVTVSLSGDGGDEFFGGYPRYHALEGLAGRAARLPGPLRQILGGALAQIPPAAINRAAARISPFLPSPTSLIGTGEKAEKLARLLGRSTPSEMYSEIMAVWNDPSSLVVGGSNEFGWGDFEDEAAGAPSITETMMFMDGLTYLPDDVMTKVDRACMAVSLESRAPLLDHRVAEFAWSLPLAYKIQGSNGKRILKDILSRHVPPALTERPKQGFGIPIGQWLCGPLRSWAEDLLNPEEMKAQGYLNPVPVQRVWQEHLAGQYNRTPMVWAVLMFQAWLAEQDFN